MALIDEPSNFLHKHRPDRHQWVIGHSFKDEESTPTKQQKYKWDSGRMDTRTDVCSICGLKRIVERKIINDETKYNVVLYQTDIMDFLPEYMPLCNPEQVYKVKRKI